MHRFTRILAIAAVLTATAVPLRAATIYVTPTGTGDGSTPGTPANLQAALTTAATNGAADELLLAQGTYAGAELVYDVTGDAATGVTDVAIRGGWDWGFLGQVPDAAQTILNGEGARRILFIDVRRAGRTANVTLEFLTLTNGRATDGNGGGAILGGSGVSAGVHGVLNLTILDSVLDQNQAPAPQYGGAISMTGGLVVERTDFIGNLAGYVGAVNVGIYDWNWGDAVHRHDHAIPASFTDCEFRDNVNVATDNGPVVMRVVGNALTLAWVVVHNTTASPTAGKTQTIAAYESTVKVTSCEFRNNRVEWWASGIDLLGSSAEITNSLFENNWAGATGVQGGGVFTGWNYEISGHPNAAETLTVTNCTFVNNKGLNTNNSILDLQSPQTAVFSNCVFKGNEQPAVLGTATLRYSRIEGTPEADGFVNGGNNLTADPSFQVDDTDYKLNWDSPLIDAGDNLAVPLWLVEDFKGAVRVFAIKNRELPVVDMGWDEYIDWTLNITAPLPGTTWLNDGTPRDITWFCSNIGGDVTIKLLKGPPDGQIEVQTIATVRCDAQSYTWTVPADLDGMDYSVKITPALYPTIEREAVPVAIQHLHLTSPNRGKWTQGSSYPITWESSGLAGATVRIELYNGATRVRTIATAAPNTGSYSWKVPFAQAPGNTYRVRISTASPSAAEDYSDADVRILPAITLSAPNGGQLWKRGTTQVIRWSYKNNPGAAVRLELYKGGVFDRTIVASTPIGAAGVGSYSWAIPSTLRPGTDYTVKVRSASWPKVFDFSNKVFSITR